MNINKVINFGQTLHE